MQAADLRWEASVVWRLSVEASGGLRGSAASAADRVVRVTAWELRPEEEGLPRREPRLVRARHLLGSHASPLLCGSLEF